MKNINNTTYIIAFSTLIIGLGMGWLFFGNPSTETHDHGTHTSEKNEVWTCSMHPQIKMNEPGECPICGMDLIPLDANSNSNENELSIKMSATAMQLANVQTAIVTKEFPVKEVKLNGKVQINESTVSSQTSHISGRIEKLIINTTGEYVAKGQVVAFVYSPELISAQEELFEAQKIKDTNPKLFEAVKKKLRNWKLTTAQIDDILASGKPSENFPILAEINGVVTSKRVTVGDHVNAGASLYEIADLSKLWILFDVYESDMEWVNIGDKITYTIQSLPSSKFTGSVSFVDPVINAKTRVAKARIKVNNNGALKPEMFVNGTLSSPVSEKDKVIVIPKTAVMWTGERSVVYVKSNTVGEVNFSMRVVTLGTSLGKNYVIIDGLLEGEEIATNGTFSIDAAAQLAGKPSMMNPEGALPMNESLNKKNKKNSQPLPLSTNATKALIPLFDAYLALKNSLVIDAFKEAHEKGSDLNLLLGEIDMNVFSGNTQREWMKHHLELKNSLKEVTNAATIDILRKHFHTLSIQMIDLAISFKIDQQTLYIQHCPMADANNGADWISTKKEIKNPYFGSAMLKCGEVISTIN